MAPKTSHPRYLPPSADGAGLDEGLEDLHEVVPLAGRVTVTARWISLHDQVVQSYTGPRQTSPRGSEYIWVRMGWNPHTGLLRIVPDPKGTVRLWSPFHYPSKPHSHRWRADVRRWIPEIPIGRWPVRWTGRYWEAYCPPDADAEDREVVQ